MTGELVNGLLIKMVSWSGYARNISTVVCAAPPEDEQVVREAFEAKR
jgi:hypothetical protein